VPPDTPAGAPSETSAYSARLLAMLRQATIGEYEIRGEIGRGGMAAVYLAYDLRLNRKVAIKVMLPELAFHEGMEDRFKREARTAAKLDHPNIVVIYSVRDDAELLFFVMKFIEGASLEQLARKYAPLPLPIAQYVLVQLAVALQYAHDEGVVHRDVKPANVLVDRRGNVLVTDFGIAKATESPTLTRTGSVIGTPAYMSPEQCMGNEQTHASDQYSLGVVAYELIAGRPPFVGPAVELQWAHVKTAAPPLLDARPDCPPALASAVMRMLLKDPAQRWASLQDAVSSLATGLVPGDDSPRVKLAEMTRVASPVRTDGMAVTPASPIPPGRSAAQATPQAPATPVVATPPQPHPPVSEPPRPPAVASIHIHPLASPLEVGMTHVLACTVADASGKEIAGAEVDWASSNPLVAAVNASGELSALAIGKATIAATCQAHSATLSIEVVPDRVAEVILTPATVTLHERTSARIAVRANNGRGKAIAGRQVTLQSADARIASVAPDGIVVGKGVGRTTVSATLEGRTGSAEVVVRPAAVAAVAVTPQAPSLTAGDAVVFAAALRDATGHALSGRNVTWRSSDASVLSIDPMGRATSAKAGTAEVTAECEGVRAAVRVAVAPPVITELDVEPPSSPLRAGKRVRLRAKARDTTGRELEPDAVQWRSSDASVATVASDGTVSAVAPGEVTITAILGDRQARSPISVVAAPPPPRSPIAALIGGGVVVAIVAGVFLFTRGGNPSEVRPATANDTAAKTATVAPAEQPRAPTGDTGAATARNQPADSTPARPALGGPAPEVTALRVTGRTPILLESGQASRVALRATASDGSAAPLPSGIIWTSANPTVASVSASGTVTGRAEGRTSLTATAGNVTTSVDVIVSRPSPAAVTITSRAGSIKIGEQTTLAARVRDRAGLALPYSVVWRSSNPGVATVDKAGSVRGVRQGETMISAVAGGATDSVRVTVTSSVAANPQPPSAEPVTQRAADDRSTERPPASGGSGAAATAEVDAALTSAARTISAGFARGQLGQLAATSQFSKTVRDDQPQVAGPLEVQKRSVADGKAEGDVIVPLRWKTFTGGVKTGSVVLHITLEQQGGVWRLTSARNTNHP
jgi:serine/threonine protein kinase/uncharacterized protein YjdB